MKLRPNLSNSPINQKSFFLIFALIFSMTFCVTIKAQQTPAQLSLADILIGLRSKKATIDEKNKLLSEAAKVRGITFELTPEIEKELENTGADKILLAAIRSKSAPIKTETPKQPQVTAIQAVTEQAPKLDVAFYQNSAKEHLAQGEFDAAIADYGKAIELNPKDAAVYNNRAVSFYNQKKFAPAVADYDKVIELNPKNANAYFKRGDAYEKMGDSLKAVADYQKTLELEAGNEPAKTALERLQAAEIAKNAPKQPTPAPPKTVEKVEKPAVPDSVDLGQLNDNAVKLAMPSYPQLAQKANIQGLVLVKVTLDEEGKVTSVKAAEGPMMLRAAAEDAARRSKFKAATFSNQPVKATGFVKYNFKL